MVVATQTKKASRKLYLESYGCQMNEYDSGIVKNILKEANYESISEAKEADLILLNTCAIREKAQERIYGRLETFTYLKKRNPKLLIGILGCMAQNLGDELFASGLPVDFVVGPDNYRQLPSLIERLRTNSKQALFNLTHLSRTESYEELQAEAVSGVLSFITIMRGCDNFCSFCVVPYTRGRERSRSPESIVNEITALIEKHDIKEVTLLGQNVNSYCYEKISFTKLIEEILAKTKIERIRFTSPHPHDFPPELLELMASEKRFCSQIHLPLQSGSSSVLERMKRNYSREEYLDLALKMKSKIKGLGLSTDIIVGFCGESDAEFSATISLVKEISFDMAYMFRYSEREHTWAKKNFKDDVPEAVKLERLSHLIEVQKKASLSRNQNCIAKDFEVLVEGYSRRSRKELMGRTLSGKVVVFPPTVFPPHSDAFNLDHFIGRAINVKIEEASSATLRGLPL